MASDLKLFRKTSLTMLNDLQAGDPVVQAAAMDRFAETYATAFYILGRSRGLTLEDAEDAAQEFMYRMTTLQQIRTFDRSKGTPLSAWMVMCFDSLLKDLRTKNKAQKRGGSSQTVRLDTQHAEKVYSRLAPVQLQAAAHIDLVAAISVWQAAQAQLRKHFVERMSTGLYDDLVQHVLQKEWMPPPAPSQSEVAKRHKTTVTQIKNLMNRNLRRKAEEFFLREAMVCSPGITESDVAQLWNGLRSLASTR